MAEITQLILNQSELGSFKTDKSRAAGYYRKNDNLHTFSVSLNNWAGLLYIQATLELYPSDNDWITVNDDYADGSTIITSINSFNITGNFVWIRAIGETHQGTILDLSFIN